MNGCARGFAAMVLVLSCCAAAAEPAPDAGYSWQRTHARVLPTGDLEWAPQPFAFVAGESRRYIDYEGGDDARAGDSPQTAWKHHPWDARAGGRAAEASGAHTYVFKGGVTYRGTLRADDSGTPDQPIRLTRDPAWGEGEAVLAGSRAIRGGWLRGDAGSAPGFPAPETLWYIDLPEGIAPRAVWAVDQGRIERIALARHPNWTMSDPDDVKSEWFTWKHSDKETLTGADGLRQVRVWAQDPQGLTDPDPNAFQGGTVWTEYVSVMGQPYPAPIEAYDPARHALRVGGPWGDAAAYGPIWMNRYYLENLPRFLDAPGEYYFAFDGPHRGRLYLRLPADRDPNATTIEVADRTTQVDIRDQSHIHISGLAFRFGNVATWHDRWWPMPDEDPAGVKIMGACRDIRVAHCRFDHVPLAVWALARGVMERIEVADNDISNADYAAIEIGGGGGRDAPEGVLRDVRVLRNRTTETGMRPRRAGQGHNLTVNFAETAEIAGNIIHRAGGAGLWAQGGKGGGARYDVPLGRILIHHNRVTDPLLWTNDYGGIETWQGGTFYVFNNVSGNPGGFWNFGHMGSKDRPREEINHASARFGFAYYFDGSFKNYVFNNIAWGKSSELGSPLAASTAFHEVIGFLNTFANNTAYRFVAPFRRQAPQGGRGVYVGNVIEDVSEVVFRHADIDRPRDVNLEAATRDPDSAAETLAYAGNVIHGAPRFFGYFQRGEVHGALESFRASLQRSGAQASEVGVMASRPPLRDPAAGDFRLARDSEARDRGARFFVPWALASTVGEWHFSPIPADPTRLAGEHWFMTASYTNRETYRSRPRNDLRGEGLTLDRFVASPLEDWAPGALALDGSERGPSLRNADADPEQSLDVGSGSFIVEAHVRVEPGRGGAIVSKMGRTGYRLGVDADGRLVLELSAGATWRGIGDKPIDDGNWRHLLVEVDRPAGQVVAYLDGIETMRGALEMSPDASLDSEADFVVGAGLVGAIDFLRVAKGTLADSRTTIGELRAWQFDGPAWRDFAGAAPVGRRDAGALELRE